jgi:hypothetical protein
MSRAKMPRELFPHANEPNLRKSSHVRSHGSRFKLFAHSAILLAMWAVRVSGESSISSGETSVV